MRAFVLIVVLIVVLGACGGVRQEVRRPHVEAQDPSLAGLASGAIGCAPDEIRVADYRSVISVNAGTYFGEVNTWTATCRGRQFFCTGSHTTQCHEAIAPAAEPPLTSSPARPPA